LRAFIIGSDLAMGNIASGQGHGNDYFSLLFTMAWRRDL
jgi:hypothetical protein